MISNGSQILYGAWTISTGCLYDRAFGRTPPANASVKALLYVSLSALWMRSACMQAELAMKASRLHSMTPLLGILRWVVTLTPLVALIDESRPIQRLRYLADHRAVLCKASDWVVVAASCYLCFIKEHRLMAVSTLAFRSVHFACDRVPLPERWDILFSGANMCTAMLGGLCLGNTLHKICCVACGVLLVASNLLPLEPTDPTDSRVAALAELMGVELPDPELPLKEQFEQLKKHATKSFSLTHHPDKTANVEKREKFTRAQELLGQLDSFLESQALSLEERVRDLTNAITDIQKALKEKREIIMEWERQIDARGPPPDEKELREMEDAIEQLKQCLES